MILGKVIGTVWSTKKDENLVGSKLLIVRQLSLDFKKKRIMLLLLTALAQEKGRSFLLPPEVLQGKQVTLKSPCGCCCYGDCGQIGYPGKSIINY